jgi:hypothetical protein
LIAGRFFVSAQFDGTSPLYSAPVDFEIKDKNIHGIQILAVEGLVLSGSLLVETASSAPNQSAPRSDDLAVDVMEVMQSTPSEGWIHRTASVAETGSFSIPGLRRGRFMIRLSRGWERWYLKRVEYRRFANAPVEMVKRDALFDDPQIDLGGTSLAGVRVVLGTCGSISGHIAIRGGFPKDANVSLSIVLQGALQTSIDVDPNGSFSREGLVPAEYELSVTVDGITSSTKKVRVLEGGHHTVSFQAERVRPGPASNQ